MIIAKLISGIACMVHVYKKEFISLPQRYLNAGIYIFTHGQSKGKGETVSYRTVNGDYSLTHIKIYEYRDIYLTAALLK